MLKRGPLVIAVCFLLAVVLLIAKIAFRVISPSGSSVMERPVIRLNIAAGALPAKEACGQPETIGTEAVSNDGSLYVCKGPIPVWQKVEAK